MHCVVSGPWRPTVEPHAAENRRAAGVHEYRLGEAHGCKHAAGVSHMEVHHSDEICFLSLLL